MAHSPGTEPAGRRARLPLVLGLSGLLAAGAIALRPGGASAEADLAFARHSEPVATRSLESLEEAVPPSTVRVFEPYEKGEASFRALPFDRVLDSVYSPSWRQEEEVLFTCRDGYQPTVPVARILRHRAWLAFDRVDEPGFAIRKRESGQWKRVELGPFYLVWENLDDAKIRQEWDYGWPYQVVSVDLIRTADRFPRLVPPAGSSAQVKAGFAAFRIHCSKCHALDGQGGSIGPELGGPASPVDTRDRQWLRDWIEDPSRIREDARMPPLNPDLPDRKETVEAILAYLEAMRSARTPSDGG